MRNIVYLFLILIFVIILGTYFYPPLLNRFENARLIPAVSKSTQVHQNEEVPDVENSGMSPFKLLFSDNVFLAPNDGSVTSFNDSGKNNETSSPEIVIPALIGRSFYKYHKDIYDFIVVLAPTFASPGFDAMYPVKNDVKGIGKDIEDNSSLYGTQGTLKGVVAIYNIESNLSEIGHEISHQWLMYISNQEPKIHRDSSHWSQFVDTATREDGVMYYSPNGGNPFIDNKNGTFSLDSTTPLPTGSHHRFHPIELYLMGLIPSSKVTPLTVWNSDSTQLTPTMRGTPQTFTVQDIINNVGPRYPGYPNTQKDFRVAYIVLPRKGEVVDSAVLEKIKRIATDFPKEWSFMTRGLSSIR